MSWLIEEQLKQQQKSNDIDLLVCTPSRDGRFTQHWLMGCLEMELPQGWKITRTMESGQPVDVSRNIAVTKALQSNARYILFWDADVIPPKLALNTLIQLKMPVVGCVYRSRGPPFQLLASVGNAPLGDELLKTPQVVEVDQIGAGFLLVDCRVLKKYARKINNWQCLGDHTSQTGEFVAAYDNDTAIKNSYKCTQCGRSLMASFFDYRAGKTRKLPVSEDYYFCKKVKDLGFKIYAATICCTHENYVSYVDQEPQLKTWLTSAADVR